jgi:hypothetical protein
MTATAVTIPGIYLGMSDTEYHARPELSSTGARRILDSPARFKWEQQNPTTSRAFDIGHAVHAKILGVGAPIVAYPDEHLTPSGNPSTKAATVAWEDEQRAAGLTIVSTADLTLVDAMTEAVLAHQGARRYLEQPGAPEASLFATDPDTGVRVRARFDYLPDLFENPDPATVDIKTTVGSASTRGFGRDAAKHGYPIQDAFYTDALEWVTGSRPPMVFVVVEKRPPHFVAVHTFDDVTRIVGRDLAARARALYAECAAKDDWPAYGDDVLTTQIPSWWFDYADDDADDMEL